MTTPVLRFERVWKKFRRGQNHDSLRDLIPSVMRRVLRRPRTAAEESREFWALSDFSFDVQPGEVLGIIGSNGAGKSTTLKLLNRIMEPTLGRVYSVGKIGALIEVSAGFHQDLTGRQNVFLQGAIMGMRKVEVARKFDEIVEFAGIGDFIDTPVKRYSSGMNARLGFSIAAHLEPEILIIDEVLAVGDYAFQKKAFGRIKRMANAGSPVVLVSHQLDRISELCTKAILLERGAVRKEGTAAECINEYLHGIGGDGILGRFGDVGIKFEKASSLDGLHVYSGEELTIRINGTAKCAEPSPSWLPAVRVIATSTGVTVHSVTGRERGIPLPTFGDFEYELKLQMNLPPGLYNIEPLIYDYEERADVVVGPRLQVEVMERMKFWGEVQLNSRWTVLQPGLPDLPTELDNSLQRA